MPPKRLRRRDIRLRAARLALSLDPAEAVGNGPRHLGFMAGSNPMISVVVGMPPTGRLIGQKKCRTIIGITGEAIQHGLYLPLAGMGPDRVGQEEVEFFAKH